MPSPSYYPVVVALGLPVIAYGIMYGRNSGQNYLVAVLGAVIVLAGLYGWALEPSAEPEEHGGEPDPSGAEGASGGDEPALVAAPSAGELGEGPSPEGDGPDGGTAGPDEAGG